MSNEQPSTQHHTPGVPQQTQPVLQAAITSYQSTVPKRNARKIPGAKFFGIFTIIIAFLLFTLGIVAIIIEAKDSYVGDPIWTSVLFILPAGALGLLSYLKRNSMCSNVSYLIMNIFACVMSAHLVIYASINAMRERVWLWWWYSDYLCNPWPGANTPDFPDYPLDSQSYYTTQWPDSQSYYTTQWPDSQWYYTTQRPDIERNCQFPSSARITVDLLIAVLAFIQFVLSIVSCAFTCYGTCTCCYNCCQVCRPASPPAAIQYTAQNGACQLMPIGANQTPNAYQPVSLMVPPGQSGQVVSPNFTVVPGQYQSQPVFMPTSSNQVTLIQQPQSMAPTPGSFVNPPMAAAPGSFVNPPMAATPGALINQPMASSPGYFVLNQPASPAPTPMAATPGFVVNPPMVAASGSFVNQPAQTAPTPMAATPCFVVDPAMVATPGSFVCPLTLTAPTSNGGMATASTASTETKPETSAPLQEPSNVAYGQTSPEQFHDKKNLLDTV